MQVAMPKSPDSDAIHGEDACLAFLAAGNDSALGYVGGYLVTTARGRPLEFHYTTPIIPNTTQQILYGAELEPHIYESLIAKTLRDQSKSQPRFLITDQSFVLGIRPECDNPVLHYDWNLQDQPGDEKTFAIRLDMQLERLKTQPGFESDIQGLRQWLETANVQFDVAEPLNRIWQAVRNVMDEDRAA